MPDLEASPTISDYGAKENGRFYQFREKMDPSQQLGRLACVMLSLAAEAFLDPVVSVLEFQTERRERETTSWLSVLLREFGYSKMSKTILKILNHILTHTKYDVHKEAILNMNRI